MRPNDRDGTEGELSERRRDTGQRRIGVTPGRLGRTHKRLSVIISQPTRLREGGAPIRVLIFDDHPATIRLLDELDRAKKRKNRLALAQISALIVVLILAMCWPLL